MSNFCCLAKKLWVWQAIEPGREVGARVFDEQNKKFVEWHILLSYNAASFRKEVIPGASARAHYS
jgi:hypothetical protein